LGCDVGVRAGGGDIQGWGRKFPLTNLTHPLITYQM
jgi:hypothetical protein